MTIQLRATSSVAGVIKFKPEISEESLIRALKMLAQKADTACIRDLHMRSGGDDGTHVIVFHYQMKKGTKREQRGITESIFAILQEVLGVQKHDTRYSISTVIATV